MGKKSQTNGKEFEKLFCDILSLEGCFVVYNEKSMSGSQCADIIAIENNNGFIYECKNLDNKTGIFPLDRIESNQRHAYKRFEQCLNDYFYLAIYWNNEIYTIPFKNIDFSKKSIDLKEKIPSYEEEYINECKDRLSNKNK